MNCGECGEPILDFQPYVYLMDGRLVHDRHGLSADAWDDDYLPPLEDRSWEWVDAEVVQFREGVHVDGI